MQRVNSALLSFGLLLIIIYRFFSVGFHFVTRVFGLPCQCKYPVTCSEFAENEFKTSKSFFGATQRVALRLISCSPFGMKGI